MKRSSKASSEGSVKKSELPTQILGVLLMALALLMAVSLLSYSPEDPPNSSRPPGLAENMVGWFGAHLSYYLLFGVGYGAHVLTALVLLWGWNRFRLDSVQPLIVRSATLFALMILYCGATGVPSRGRTYLAWKLGGWLGVTLSASFLVPYLGRVGAYIALGAALIVLLMVATEIPFGRVPEWLAQVARQVGDQIARIWHNGKEGLKSWFEKMRDSRAKTKALRAQKRAERLAEKMAEAERKLAIEAEEEDGEDWEEEEEETFEEPIPVEAFEAQIVPQVEYDGDEEDEEDEYVTMPDISEPALPVPEFEPKMLEDVQQTALPDVAIVEKAADLPPPAPVPQKTKPKKIKPTGRSSKYTLPGLDFFTDAPVVDEKLDRETLLDGAQTLEESLSSFSIKGKVVQVNPGPVITTYEVEPPPGVKVNRIVALADDLALVMKARSIRIQAPIPGKAVVGIEVPNSAPSTVYIKDILKSKAFRQSDSKLMVVLGKTSSGEPYCADLAKMPHLLIAGATGAGKSVCINTLIASILVRCTPEEVRFIMVDPKMVELSIYNDIPHLLAPVVIDPKMASGALKWAVSEMEHRYRTMSQYNARNITDFNVKMDRLRKESGADEEIPERLPYIVVIIDELADLMMTAPADIEDSLARLAQMARAVGIHLILATQRPSVNVITGTIKANFPTRIAFRVASKVDSRTIIDGNGAEKLLGYGDMLFLPPGRPEPLRIHGALISPDETDAIVEWIRLQHVELETVEFGDVQSDVAIGSGDRDERFEEALRLVVTNQQGSASLLQRRMKVGYSRAARLVDELEAAGIVGPSDGSSKGREILVGEDYLEQLEELEA
jgi:S-DNA-T family DNA segregation ATPase FtsK/SpoIIIE